MFEFNSDQSLAEENLGKNTPKHLELEINMVPHNESHIVSRLDPDQVPLNLPIDKFGETEEEVKENKINNELKLVEKRIVSSFPSDINKFKSSMLTLLNDEKVSKPNDIGRFFHLITLNRLVKTFIDKMMSSVFHRFISNLNEKSFRLIDDKSATKFRELKSLYSNERVKKSVQGVKKKSFKIEKRGSASTSNFLGPRNTILSSLNLNRKKLKKNLVQSTFLNLWLYFSAVFKTLNENYPVLNESSRICKFLQYFIIITLHFLMFIFPLEVGFGVSLTQYFIEKSYGLGIMYYVFIKMFLPIQFFIRMNCSLKIDGDEVFDRAKILHNYVKQNLIIDLISAIAIYLGHGFEESTLLCIFILVKYKEINDFSVEFEENSNFSERLDAVYRLIKLVTKILFIAHVISCLWFMLGKSMQGSNKNWIQASIITDLNSSFFHQYIGSFYWSVTTIVTVGYGDITPQNIYEMLFTVIIILIGCGVFGYSLNSIGNIIEDFSAGECEYREVIKIMNRTLKRKKIPSSISNKVKKYLRYSWKEELAIEREKIFMNKLPSSLKKEIFLHTNTQILDHVKFLTKNFSPNFLDVLKQYFEQVKIAPEENIVKEGSYDDRSIYVVYNGSATLYHQGTKNNKEHIIKVLREKDSFGELSFITGQPRSASVKSNGFCIVYKLSYEKFHQILAHYPKDLELFFMIRERLKSNSERQILQSNCYSCGKPSHYSKECPYFNHIVRDRIMQVCVKAEKGLNFRRKFIRKNVCFRVFKENGECQTEKTENENRILVSNSMLPSTSQLGISIDQTSELSHESSFNNSLINWASRAEMNGNGEIILKLPRPSLDIRRGSSSLESENIRRALNNTSLVQRQLNLEEERGKSMIVAFECMKNYSLFFPMANAIHLIKRYKNLSNKNYQTYIEIPKSVCKVKSKYSKRRCSLEI